MNGSSNLIVNYLPQAFTDRELYSMFSTIGQIESCKVMKDFKTGYSFGFGFVNYVRPEDAERAITQLNGTEIYNKRVKVSYARPSGDDIKDTNLYVTNLPRHYKDSDLETLFGGFGTIVQKNLLMDKTTGLPRGVAFVRFNKREEAQEAIRHLDGHVPEGGNEQLTVKVAVEHGKQKAAYFAGFHAGFQQSRGRGDSVRGVRGISRGGPPNLRGNLRDGRTNNDPISYLPDQLISYPIRANLGFGPIRHDKNKVRFNPLGFGVANNGYPGFYN